LSELRGREGVEASVKMEEFEVLAQGLFTQNDVQVDYRPGRHVRWGQSAETFIENTWQAHMRASCGRGMTAYNGNVFHLDAFNKTSDRLFLTVSDMEFRSCIGTGTADFAVAFPQEPQANPLSVSIVLVTIDGKIVLEKRSRIDARRRRYHVIAGFMEHGHDVLDSKLHPFDTIKREVREELGLTFATPLYATGLVRAITGSEICFYSRLNISYKTLLEIKATEKTDAEIEALEAIDDSPTAIADFLADHTADLVYFGRACLLLYGHIAYGKEWYEKHTATTINTN
jgi:8-oxo-dGTP pyrophosphatase MutT (NUDIX family)